MSNNREKHVIRSNYRRIAVIQSNTQSWIITALSDQCYRSYQIEGVYCLADTVNKYLDELLVLLSLCKYVC